MAIANLEEGYLESIELHGALTIGSRIKRLSETLTRQVQDLYKESGKNIKPYWFPLLFVLYREKSIDVQSAAKILLTTHSSISQTLKELEAQELVKFERLKEDMRFKKVSLSEEGKQLLIEAIPNLQLVEKILDEIFGNQMTTLLKLLDKFETSLKDQSIKERRYKFSELKIVPYEDKYKGDFERINREWLEPFFANETPDKQEYDKKIFANPRKAIIDNQGAIFIALMDDEAVGCVGIRKLSDKTAELVRFGVNSKIQGKGIGQKLLDTATNCAKELGYKEIYLDTVSSLKAALHLYKKNGFLETESYGTECPRVDVYMKKDI